MNLYSLLDAENVPLDDEVVVRSSSLSRRRRSWPADSRFGRHLASLDRLSGVLGIEPLGFRQPPRACLGRRGQEYTGARWGLRDSVNDAPWEDDDDVAIRSASLLGSRPDPGCWLRRLLTRVLAWMCDRPQSRQPSGTDARLNSFGLSGSTPTFASLHPATVAERSSSFAAASASDLVVDMRKPSFTFSDELCSSVLPPAPSGARDTNSTVQATGDASPRAASTRQATVEPEASSIRARWCGVVETAMWTTRFPLVTGAWRPVPMLSIEQSVPPTFCPGRVSDDPLPPRDEGTAEPREAARRKLSANRNAGVVEAAPADDAQASRRTDC